MKRTVRSEIGEVTVRETSLVYSKAFSGVEIGLKEAKDYLSMVEYLTQNKSHISVIDISGIKYISNEARNFLASNSSKWGKTVGVALIVNSFTARMVSNFFLTVNKPSYPIKVFSDTLLAQQWANNEYYKFAVSVAS